MKKLFILILLVLLASCTPQQRLNRLLGNHPYLAKQITKDTILTTYENDTLYLPDRTIDTFFSFKIDTFTVVDSGVNITITKYVDKWHLKTVVKADTIIYRDTVKIAYKDVINSFNVQPISTTDIWKYRKQGALWLFIILIIIYLVQLGVRLYLKSQLPFLKP